MAVMSTQRTDMADEMDKPTRMHPHKFILYLFIVSILMIFASLTSAYIVRKGEGNWVNFQMPSIFYYSSVVILISSILMQWAVSNARANNIAMLRISMVLTAFFGTAFLVMQYLGWQDLQAMGIEFDGNVSGSFFYVLVGVHAFHLISGMVFLMIMLGAALSYKVHSKQMTKIEMCATYWHFLDALWFYLFVFLLFSV